MVRTNVIRVSFVGAALAIIISSGTALLSDPRSLALWSDMGWTVSSLFAVIVTGWAWRRTRADNHGRAWRWAFLGTAAWFIAQLIWDFYDVELGVVPTYPSVADLGYLVSSACYLLAVVSFLRGSKQSPRDDGFWLDVIVVGIAATAILWVEVIHPALNSDASVAGRLFAASWASSAVVTGWLGIVLLLRRERARPERVMFLGAQLILGAADVWYATTQMGVGGGYVSGRWVDLSWSLAFIIIALAAARVRVQPHPEAEARATLTTPREVSVGVVILALVLLAWLARRDTSGVASVGILVGGVALAVRLVRALREDDAYAGRLRADVASRTQELEVSLRDSREAERRLRSVMDAVPDAIATADSAGTLRDDNGQLSQWFQGHPPRDVDALVAAFAEADREAAAHGAATARSGTTASWEGVLATEPPRNVATTAVCAAELQGAVLFVLRDVSEQRRAEQWVQATERLATLGELASGVAHEINNPAAIVAALAEAIESEAVSDGVRERVSMIHSEAMRIGAITRGLLQLTRGEPSPTDGAPIESCDVRELTTRVLQLHGYRLKTAGIVTALDLEPNLRAAIGANEYQQVLLNLVVNAEQALYEHFHGHGTIRIVARSVDDQVEVSVIDDGPGVAPRMREKLFQPFETSKATGTGIGLSLSRTLIRRAGGDLVLVPSEVGCVFRITVPRGAAAIAHEATKIATPIGHALRILLVDDEPTLLRLVARLFEKNGHHVETAGNGIDALAKLDRGQFDVLVTDSRMPGMDGPTLIEAVRKRADGGRLGIVLTSGDTSGDRVRALATGIQIQLVAKPFTQEDLERAVQASLPAVP